MKAKLIFNLDDEYDREHFRIACKANDYARALTEVNEKMRKLEKYEDDKPFTREMFFEIINSYDLSV